MQTGPWSLAPRSCRAVVRGRGSAAAGPRSHGEVPGWGRRRGGDRRQVPVRGCQPGPGRPGGAAGEDELRLLRRPVGEGDQAGPGRRDRGRDAHGVLPWAGLEVPDRFQ